MDSLNKELERFLSGTEKKKAYNEMLKGFNVVPVEQIEGKQSFKIYDELLYKKIYRSYN